jgi:hypothetical protein
LTPGQAQAQVREVVAKLAAVRFADLVQTNEETSALHEADADALCSTTNGSGSTNGVEVQGESPSTNDLRTLRTQLETLLLEAGLNITLDLDY